MKVLSIARGSEGKDLSVGVISSFPSSEQCKVHGRSFVEISFRVFNGQYCSLVYLHLDCLSRLAEHTSTSILGMSPEAGQAYDDGIRK